MVDSMRDIGPSDPDLVVNALVDYPVVWNWLLTAVTLHIAYLSSNVCYLLQNLFVLAFDTFLVIATFLRRERLLRVYLVLSLANIVHTAVVVLPTIFVNLFSGAIAKYIEDQQVTSSYMMMKKAMLDNAR